jgi:hypothetical protein
MEDAQFYIKKDTPYIRKNLENMGYNSSIKYDEHINKRNTMILRPYVYALSDTDFGELNSMLVCNNEEEFLARAAMLIDGCGEQYYISDYYPFEKLKNIPENRLKNYRKANIYEIKEILGHEYLHKFKIGKYSGEYVCKIIKDDLGYVTWCLSKMRGFRLLNIEKEYYEHAMFVNSLINIR